MSDLDTTIAGLNDLNKTAKFSAIEFQGLTKSLIKMADSTSKAGKKWTILSRFLSGTPLWKVQNYVRATIGVFAELENSSQDVMKAQEEQNKTFMESIKNYDVLNKQVKDMNFLMKDLGAENSKVAKMVGQYNRALERRKNIEESLDVLVGQDLIDAKDRLKIADKDLAKRKEHLDIIRQQKNTFEESLEDNITYQKILLATGDAEKARFAAVKEYNKQFAIETKRRKVIETQAREAFAFDKTRVKNAKQLADLEAKKAGKGKIGRFFARAGAGRKERKDISLDQSIAKDEALKGFGKSIGSTFSTVGKSIKPLGALVAPVFGIMKLAKASFPFTKESKKFQIKMFKLGQRTMKVLDFFFKYMMLGIVVAGAILIGMKYFQELYGLLSEMGVVDRIKDLGKDLMSILGDVFSVVDAFIKGDYEKIVPLLGKIFDKAVLFLLKTLGVLLDVGFLALVAGFKLVGDFIVEFLENPSFREKIFKGLKVLLLFVAGFIVLKVAVAQLLLLAGIAALPVALGVVVLAAGFTIAKYFGDKLSDKFKPLIDGVWTIVDSLKRVRNKISQFGKKLRDMPFFANGGVSSGGLAVVGERGPELVNLPAGARVNSNRESRKMAGGTTNNINITINARDTSDQELRRIADKIGQMVNTKINRTTSSRTFGG